MIRLQFLFLFFLSLTSIWGQSTNDSALELFDSAKEEVRKLEARGMRILHVEIGQITDEMNDIALIRDLSYDVEYHIVALGDSREIKDVDLALFGQNTDTNKQELQIRDADNSETARLWYVPTQYMDKYFSIKVLGYDGEGNQVKGKFCVIIAKMP